MHPASDPALAPARPPLVVITGPTASGKSALALALADTMPTTIINADASQLYADLSVLTARPDVRDVARAPHALYGVLDGADGCDASRWATLARQAIAAARADGRVPVLVGGTGLYLGVLLDGIAPIPPIDPAIRAAVRALPVADAYRALALEDGIAAASLHAADTTRVARALEVVRATGRSIRWWQARTRGGITDSVRLIPRVVLPPRPALVAAADARAARMLAGGAVEEVRALLARRLDPTLPVMRAIGVREVTALIDGHRSEAATLDALRLATRQYIKRQTTWMRGRGGKWERLFEEDNDRQLGENVTKLREAVDDALSAR